MKLVNTMERAVKEQFEDMKDHFLDFCWCERCRYDVLALTLNCLPPTYVVSEEGEIFSRTATLRQQYQADIAVALVQAVIKVKADPRH